MKNRAVVHATEPGREIENRAAKDDIFRESSFREQHKKEPSEFALAGGFDFRLSVSWG